MFARSRALELIKWENSKLKSEFNRPGSMKYLAAVFADLRNN